MRVEENIFASGIGGSAVGLLVKEVELKLKLKEAE